jgi:hypothetical protein
MKWNCYSAQPGQSASSKETKSITKQSKGHNLDMIGFW